MRSYLLSIVFTLTYLHGTALSQDHQMKLDVCDISFLWNVPTTVEEANSLISIDSKLTKDGKSVCRQSLFNDLIQNAETLVLNDPISNQPVQIEFLNEELKEITNWKIAGIRIDPSAPGCSQKIRDKFGSRPQVRIICQPVTTSNGNSIAHDFAIHLIYDYVKNSNPPFEADSVAFKEIIDELLSIKKELKSSGIDTSGTLLGVHPGFSSSGFHLTERLKKFLKNHLHSNRIKSAAFMGIQDGFEPWIFFAVSKDPASDRHKIIEKIPSLRPSKGQVLSFVTQSRVFPIPNNRQFGAEGVSILPLLQIGRIDRRVFPNSTDPLLSTIQVRDISDIIANPERSHFLTTDCISCHTESSIRDSKLSGVTTQFSYNLPENISAIDPNVLPKNRTFKNWNIRNFGWGFENINKMAPTVTMRTANEAAESVDFINKTYLKLSTTKHGVSNPLTLIMTCKDEQSYNQLKAKIKVLLARDDNSINKALDSIGIVHYARFVFLEESKQVAVITAYDGEFDVYINRFVDHIGDVFNLILEHVKGTDDMKNDDGKVNVQSHTEQFLKFVKKHDLRAVEPFYSAYPNLTVQDIKELHRMANE
ncbi:hypothetical protein [uncultured Gimesia sp.]|uniref:hypothetical protein n=1 Tax=uncultured Gimesia sp. TaxID=1678688 RepID=UPI0030D9235F